MSFWPNILGLKTNSNTCSILELMLCNSNLTKLDILILLSSDCRAWALKLSGHSKKLKKNIFYLHFANSKFNVFFLSSFCNFFFSPIFFTKFMWWIPFLIYQWLSEKFLKFYLKKKVKLSMKPTWHYCFLLSFSLTRHKTKAEPSNSTQ